MAAAAGGGGSGGGGKHTFKVVLLGEGCVGKTSLVMQYCRSTFNESHDATLQASFLTKRLNVQGERVELAIWDTAGQERFHALGPIYYRDANGALLVYDITDEDSFQKVRNWVKELRLIVGNDIPIIIAGNKADMEKNRHVKEEDAQAYAQTVGAVYIETSAKFNKNVEQVFLELTKRMLANAKSGEGATNLSRSKSKSKSLVIADDDPNLAQPSGKCC